MIIVEILQKFNSCKGRVIISVFFSPYSGLWDRLAPENPLLTHDTASAEKGDIQF